MSNSYALDLSAAFGYMSRHEVMALESLSLMAMSDNPIFINVGAGAGTSGLALTEGNPNATIYTVDFRRDGGPLGGLQGERNAFMNTGLALPIQIQGDSYEVGKTIS